MDRLGELARKAKGFEKELQAWAVSSGLIKSNQRLTISVGVPVPMRHDVHNSSSVMLDLHHNYLNRPLSELRFSKRVLSIFTKAGIKTLGDLLRLEKSPQESLIGIGDSAMKEIGQKIHDEHIPFTANWA